MKNFLTEDAWLARLAKDSFTYLIGKLIPSLAGFLTVILLSRVFGATVYGQFSVAISIILTAETILSGWLVQGVLRFYSEYGAERKRAAFESIWKLCLAILPVGFVILGGIFAFATRDNWPNILVSLVVFSAATAFTLQSTFLQADLKPKIYVVWESVRTVLIPVFTILLFWSFRSKNSLTILSGHALAFLLVIVLMLAWQEKFRFRFHAAFDRALFRDFLHFGAPLTLWLGSSYLLNVSSRYIIAGFRSYQEAGIYSAAYDAISKGIGILFMPIVIAAHPLIMDRWNKKDYPSALSILKRGILYELLLFVPIAIGLFIFRRQIVLWGLGPEYQGAENILLPVAGGSFLWRLSMLLHKPLELRKKTMLMAALVTLALIINVLANLVFVPRYGYIAAAYTTIASFFVYFAGIVAYIFLSKRPNDPAQASL